MHDVELQKFAEERIVKLQITPANAYVSDNFIYKYKCPCYETRILEAQRHRDPIPKSIPNTGLLFHA